MLGVVFFVFFLPGFYLMLLIDSDFLLKVAYLNMIWKMPLEKFQNFVAQFISFFSLKNCSSLNPACVLPASAF